VERLVSTCGASWVSSSGSRDPWFQGGKLLKRPSSTSCWRIRDPVRQGWFQEANIWLHTDLPLKNSVKAGLQDPPSKFWVLSVEAQRLLQIILHAAQPIHRLRRAPRAPPHSAGFDGFTSAATP